MFCSNCGKPVADDAAFCANCGTALKAQSAPVAETLVEETPVAEPVAVAAPVEAPVAAPAVETPVQEAPPVAAPAPEAQNVYTNAPTFQANPVVAGPSASSVMVKGILAIVFACTFYLSFLGIVFGAIAKNAAAQFMAANGGQVFGQAKVGSILGKVGLIVGIVMTAIFVIWLICLLALI